MWQDSYIIPLAAFAIIHDKKSGNEYFTDEHESYKTCPCNFAGIIRERMVEFHMDDIRLEIMMKEQKAVVEMYKTAKAENPAMDLEDIKVIVGERISARMAEYEQLIFVMKTKQQLLFSHHGEIAHSLDIIRAERLRLKDKLYKPLTPDPAGEAVQRISQREKQIKGIQKVFSCGRDEAEAFLLNPAKIPGKTVEQEPEGPMGFDPNCDHEKNHPMTERCSVIETNDPAPEALEVLAIIPPATCSKCETVLPLEYVEKKICGSCAKQSQPTECEKCGVKIDTGTRCSDCLIFS